MAHGRRPFKRTAYVSMGFALIPDDDNPGILRRVPTRVLFFDCPVCGRLAGQRCRNNDQEDVAWCHGDRGHGKQVRYEDRVAMSAGLIAAKRFDEVHILDTRAVLKKEAE